MLAAHRDPFHPSAYEPKPSGSRFTRTMNVLQIAGALLAIPVGVGSAVTMYRSNFSVEATCQSLRGNIVALIDKRVDSATRHMLVRRDVESFEQACGGVDPDATAAFKVLLAAEKKPAAVTPVVARPAEAKPQETKSQEVKSQEAKPQEAKLQETKSATVAHKPEPRVEAVKEVKDKVGKPSRPVIAESWIAEEEGASDAVWMNSVRRALGTPARSAPSAAPEPTVQNASAPAATAVIRRAPVENSIVNNVPAPAATLSSPAPAPSAVFAPALPLATSVAAVPAPRVDPDHPVPPASIPEVTANDNRPPEAEHSSRFGWIARIPLVGQTLVR